MKFLNRVCKAVSDSRHMRKTTKNYDEIETNASDDDGRYDDKNIERIKRSHGEIITLFIWNQNYEIFLSGK